MRNKLRERVESLEIVLDAVLSLLAERGTLTPNEIQRRILENANRERAEREDRE